MRELKEKSLKDCLHGRDVDTLKGKDEAGWEDVVRKQGGPWTLCFWVAGGAPAVALSAWIREPHAH